MIRYLKMFLVGFIFFNPIKAQIIDFNAPLPFDSTVLTGKLKNGIPYFIKNNPNPKGRVEICLVVNVGSADEDRDQLGLAHFLEHMAFRSTRHFPNSSMKLKLQTYGINGLDANAYTNESRTLYKVKAPTNNDSAIVNSFYVMADRINGLSFDSAEFETERGVLLQEWREEKNVNENYKIRSFLLNKSRYARKPIGDSAILRSCSLSQLKRFYNDWYKPELMSIIVAGDIDIKEYEKKIHNYLDFQINGNSNRIKSDNKFSGYNEPQIYVVPLNYVQNYVNINYKAPYEPDTTIGNFCDEIKREMLFNILLERLKKISALKPPPFFEPSGWNNKYWYPNTSGLEYSFILSGDISNSLKQFFTEIERLKRYGISNSEMVISKANLLRSDIQDNLNSFQVACNIMDYCLFKKPFFPDKWSYNFLKNYLPYITNEELKFCAKQTFNDSNLLIVFQPLFDQKIPVDSIYQIIRNVINYEITPPVHSRLDSFYVTSPLKTGRIVKEEKRNPGITVLTLSNNVKIYLKPTSFKKDEIVFRCFRSGGLSNYLSNDFYSAKYAAQLVNQSGYSFSSNQELVNALWGKNITLTPYMNLYDEGIGGYTVKNDFEVFLQLLYEKFTKPDLGRTIANSWTDEQKNKIKNNLTIWENYFNYNKINIIYKNNPWIKLFDSPDDIDKVNYTRSLEIYKERFGNAAGFSFLLAGNFNVDSIKPLLVKWIGTLPSGKKINSENLIKIERGNSYNHKKILCGTEDKSEVLINYFKKVRLNPLDNDNRVVLQFVLKSYLDKILREEMGGVYTTSVNFNLDKGNICNTSISFKCSVKDVDTLACAVYKIINRLKKGEIEPEIIEKAKQQILNEEEENKQNNYSWIGAITYYEINLKGKIKDPIKYFERNISQVTVKDISNLATKIFGGEIFRIDCLPIN